MRRASALITATVGLLTADLAADNWPHWRGPSATGVSKEVQLPVKWGETENIAWRVAVARAWHFVADRLGRTWCS